MAGDQMDLLTWKPTCRIMAFPPARRSYRVRWIAENLLRKHGGAADAYWKQTITRTRNELHCVGIPEREIETELRAFFDAVQAEMVRLTYRVRQPKADAARSTEPRQK
jgi:hypothetical protein